MKSIFEDQARFMGLAGQFTDGQWARAIPQARRYINHIKEELHETNDAWDVADWSKVIDGLVDIIVCRRLMGAWGRL